MSTANADFDRVATTTLKNYANSGAMADNISNHIPFLGVMQNKGSVKLDGGDKIVLELMHEFSNAFSYSGSDVWAIDVEDGISAAEYNWKQVGAPVTIKGIEKARNAGKSKQDDLIKAAIMQAELSLEDAVSVMLFSDGTGNLGKDLLGLEAIIAQNPNTGVLGGIDSSVETFWRNQTDTSVGSFASNGEAALSTLMRATQRGTDRVDLMVTGSTIYGYMQALANGRAQYTNPKLAQLGFDALRFEGTDFIFDANCPADRIYGVNTRWLKLYIHKDYNFVTGKFIEPANQDQMTAKIKLYAQLATDRREAHFVASGISA